MRPQWLCSTFAFHPMMGFRRQRQAESIAHGCASTIDRMQRIADSPETRPWARAWGMRIDPVARPAKSGLKPRADVPLGTGGCVFRSDATCLFSPIELKGLGLQAETTRHLEEVYYACRRAETHQRPPA